jgi:RteC protein
MEREMQGVEFYQTLLRAMLDELEEADIDRRPGAGYGSMMLIVRRNIDEFQSGMDGFPDRDTEITFFRGIWPVFYGKLFYYLLLHGFETDRAEFAESVVIEREETRIKQFFAGKREFWLYYKAGSSLVDEQFTRAYSKRCVFDPLCQVLDRERATLASYWAAWGLAYEEYREYLAKKIAGSGGSRRTYEWKEGKTAAVELIKAQVEAGSVYIDGKPATAVQLRADHEARYGEDLKDFDKLLYATDTRKKDQTPYLTKLKNAFVGRKERLGK